MCILSVKYVKHLHLPNYSVYTRVQLFIHQMSFAVFEVKLECVHTLFKHDVLFRELWTRITSTFYLCRCVVCNLGFIQYADYRMYCALLKGPTLCTCFVFAEVQLHFLHKTNS